MGHKHSNETLEIAKKVTKIDSYCQSLEDTNKYLYKKAETISSDLYDDSEGIGWQGCSEKNIKSCYFQLLALLIDNDISEDEALNF